MFMSVRLIAAATRIGKIPKAERSSSAGETKMYGARRERPCTRRGLARSATAAVRIVSLIATLSPILGAGGPPRMTAHR